LKVPVIWEHLDVEENDDEEWKANYAKHTIGRLGGARLATGRDVAEGLATATGTLMVRHDIYDQKDADQLRKTGGVSPKIYRGYLDSTGEEFSGLTVAHSAITPTPVQWWQAPFSVSLSNSEALCLAYPHPSSEVEKPESCPSQDWSFDSWLDQLGPLELSVTEPPEEPPVADENKSEEKPKGGDDKGGGMAADLKALIDALKTKGMSISDKVTNLHELTIAVESSSGGDAPEPEPEPEPGMGGDDGAGTAGAPSGPPMLMSTLDRDTGKRKKAEGYAKPEREEATARIKAAFKAGKIDGALHRKLLRQADGFEMSFTDGEQVGKKWNTLLKAIADAEKEPAGKFAVAGKGDGIDLSTTTNRTERPNLGGKTVTPERGQLGADIILGKKSVKDA
jgi:hypothetical protein